MQALAFHENAPRAYESVPLASVTRDLQTEHIGLTTNTRRRKLNTLEQQLDSEVITQSQPSPNRFFETMNAYQRTAALKAAIELEVFTVIGDTSGTIPELVQRIKVPERGLRALCDFLVVMGFASKFLDEPESRYALTPDSAMFLDKKSPRYIGLATTFMGSTFVTDVFRDLTAVIRAGGPLPDQLHVNEELPIWVDFARGMAPIMYSVAESAATFLKVNSEAKVLDIAAGHGLFGIAVARENPKAKIVALDFPSVLHVAKENAERFGVADRYTLLPGDALQVPFGKGFDGALVANLLHHWDRPTIQTFLRKVYDSLAPGGRIVVVEFAPNDDRVSPPIPASFVMNMLAMTPGGNAYTLSENLEMLREAGFSECDFHHLLPTPQSAIVGVKR
jgi:ubiquinone/menaquinone biosynthesis C-methylase UbiE